MADTIKRLCPRCGGAFYLNGGVARCPHPGCGVSVKAIGTRPLRGRPQRPGRPRRPRQQAAPSIQPDSETIKTRALIRKQLTANHQYWVDEAHDIEAEFGMIPAWLGELLR